LFETIRQAGIESDLRLYGRQIHEFVRLPNMLHTTIRDAVAFFDRTALSRESYEREFEQLREWWKQIFSAHTPH
jgi:acetyl esterase/lipase